MYMYECTSTIYIHCGISSSFTSLYIRYSIVLRGALGAQRATVTTDAWSENNLQRSLCLKSLTCLHVCVIVLQVCANFPYVFVCVRECVCVCVTIVCACLCDNQPGCSVRVVRMNQFRGFSFNPLAIYLLVYPSSDLSTYLSFYIFTK